MRIGRSVPVTREMLEAALYLLLLQSCQESLHHRTHQFRRGTESPVANHHVVRIGIHIAYRCQVYVKAIAEQVFADGTPRLFRFLRIAGRTHRSHGTHPGNREVWILSDTGHTASFLIHANQRIIVQSMQILGKCARLIRVGDVGSEQGNTPAGILAEKVRQSVRATRNTANRARDERLDPHVEQLAHFLAERHLPEFLQLIFLRFFRRLRPRILRTGCRKG